MFPAKSMNFLYLHVLHFTITIRILQARPYADSGYILPKLSNHSISDEIVFPNSEEAPENIDIIKPIKGLPLCAKNGDTFCENVEDYPYKNIQKVLTINNKFSILFGVEAGPDEFVERIDFDNENFICEAEQKLIFPTIGKTKDNTWQYIINQKNSSEGYIQGIRIETCKKLGEPCELVNSFPSGYITKCKQKYMYKRLLSITGEEATVKEFFEFPSACCCSYKRDISFLRNFGLTRIYKK